MFVCRKAELKYGNVFDGKWSFFKFKKVLIVCGMNCITLAQYAVKYCTLIDGVDCIDFPKQF